MNISNKMRYGTKIVVLFLVMFCLLGTAFAQGVYAANDIEVKVNVEQVFSGDNTDDEFIYKLVPKNVTNPMPQSDMITLKGSENKDFNITFITAGQYDYELILESYPTQSGYVLDDQKYKLSIYVQNVQNGGLSSDVITYKSDGSKGEDIVYHQSYASLPSDPSIMVDPPVKKSVNGNPSKNSTFKFALIAGDPTNPMPEGSENGVKTMTIVGSGEKDFGTWSYTKPGIYFYTVKEINTGETEYDYDKTIYTITDNVSDNSGQLEVNRVVTNDNNKAVTSFSFVNVYTGKGNPDSPITGDATQTTPFILMIIFASTIALGSLGFIIFKTRKKEDAEEI